ncbi:mechanosensitive ion channel family protein [Haloarchaeobius litoreus]|uniref:Mechanosensitive ion channel family protein n=1 Tax=Haloarchaeobius litoreus TaxID=755306 RepID=A0ABD6DJI4_9EURY|nr:mechanosensitive ion channel family protein [Haloarchaeobius litoreus]
MSDAGVRPTLAEVALRLQSGDPSWVTELVEAVNSIANVVESPLLRVLVTVAAVVLLAAIGYVTNRVQDKLRERLGNTVADVLTVVLIGATVLASAAVVVGVWSSADEVAAAMQNLPITHEDSDKVLVSVVLVLLTHILSRLVKRVLEDYLSTTEAFSDHQRRLTYRISQVILWTGATIVALGVWDIQLTGLLVGAGFAGIVVGMAARQTLGAVLAGFVLMFSRPFEIGDWVEIGETEGIVTDISIFNTRVQTFDGEYVMIPNDVVSGQQITNRSRKGRLRLAVEVGVDYDADVEAAVETAAEAIEGLDTILTVPTPQVVVKRFGDSAVVLGIRFWIDNPSARRKWRARTAVVTAVKEAFDDAGVAIPFPQRTVGTREPTDEAAGEAVSAAEPAADGGE